MRCRLLAVVVVPFLRLQGLVAPALSGVAALEARGSRKGEQPALEEVGLGIFAAAVSEECDVPNELEATRIVVGCLQDATGHHCVVWGSLHAGLEPPQVRRQKVSLEAGGRTHVRADSPLTVCCPLVAEVPHEGVPGAVRERLGGVTVETSHPVEQPEAENPEAGDSAESVGERQLALDLTASDACWGQRLEPAVD